ncbi:TonB-dependent receptor plug domain-containing protein [Sphingobacterium sp. UT-1RO-CII-1]|uniref:TonB-dependent receptor plug domain-containing protein n=1 Tax=Sphingobacterium sp. UT-1RO-CII-1 TaxID=2995225 RepID=UPI00227BF78B|nr:TonB-dependent receptor plug domain-containing protein [Sphingobacterium sp. UT-1RO-CII-1]
MYIIVNNRTLDTPMYRLIIIMLFSVLQSFGQHSKERLTDSLSNRKAVQLEEIQLLKSIPRRNHSDQSIRMGKAEIQQTFKFLGNLDPLNAVRVLPGVASGGDLNSGLYVRGGDNGHNLIQYNGITIYNPHHLFGLFPLINPEMVNHIRFYNGAPPAFLSGRLSAYIQMQSAQERFDSLSNEIAFHASILNADFAIKKKITPRFYLEGQARKSFLNLLVWPFINKKNPTGYDIYDLNINLYYRWKNGFTQLTSYQGEDRFKMQFNKKTVYQKMDWGNRLVGLYHQQQLGEGHELKAGLSQTAYNYKLDFDYNSSGSNIFLKNNVSSLQYDLKYKFKRQHGLEVGYIGSFHRINPVDIHLQMAESGQQLNHLKQRILQHHLFLQTQLNIAEHWSAQAGLAFVKYQNNDYNDQKVQSVWNSWEPTITFSYLFKDNYSFKLGWNRAGQHIQNIAMSATSLPLDFWIGGGAEISPSTQDQYTMGFYFLNNKQRGWELSAEAFYRDLKNVYEFNGDINSIVEKNNVVHSLYQGRAKSYGVEIYAKYVSERLQSTTAYTYSRAFRWFDDLNDGNKFPFKYDRPHQLNMNVLYQISEFWKLSSNFNLESGLNYTPEVGRYFLNNNILSEYGPYNSVRMPLYHRLDLGVSRNFTTGNRIKHEIGLHIINVYNRANPLFRLSHYEGSLDEGGQYIHTSQKDLAVLPFIPMFSYSVRL